MKHEQESSELLTQALAQIKNGQATIESFLASHPDQAKELRPQLEAALWLHQHQPSLEARPGFLSTSKAYLIENLRSSPTSQSKPSLIRRQSSTNAQRRPLLEALSLLVLIACLVFATHNILLMAELSLPGEPFYVVKRSLEISQLAFTFDPLQDARLQVEFSQQRASETIALLLDKNYQELPRAVQNLQRQMEATLSAIAQLERSNQAESLKIRLAFREELETESMILSVLRNSYPVDERPYVDLALAVTNDSLTDLQD